MWVVVCKYLNSSSYKWDWWSHGGMVLFGRVGFCLGGEPWALSLRRDLWFRGWGCICQSLRRNQQAALRTPAWPVLLWFKEIKLYPIEKELKSCCFWECYFNVLVQWVGPVVYNSETPEHLWIVREVHYSLSAVRHSSCQPKLQSSHQDAEHYLWPVTGHE